MPESKPAEDLGRTANEPVVAPTTPTVVTAGSVKAEEGRNRNKVKEENSVEFSSVHFGRDGRTYEPAVEAKKENKKEEGRSAGEALKGVEAEKAPRGGRNKANMQQQKNLNYFEDGIATPPAPPKSEDKKGAILDSNSDGPANLEDLKAKRGVNKPKKIKLK